MEEESGIPIGELRADGGPTRNRYLMQFQSDMAGIPVSVPPAEELSGIGAAYAAGLPWGYMTGSSYLPGWEEGPFRPAMDPGTRDMKYGGWKHAVAKVLN